MAKLTYNNKIIEGFYNIKTARKENGQIIATDANKFLNTGNGIDVLKVEGNVGRITSNLRVVVIGNVKEVMLTRTGNHLENEGLIKNFPRNVTVQVDKDVRVVYGKEDCYKTAYENPTFHDLIKRPIKTVNVSGDLCNIDYQLDGCLVVIGDVQYVESQMGVYVKGNIENILTNGNGSYKVKSTFGEVPPIDYKKLVEEQDTVFDDVFGDIFTDGPFAHM